MIRQRVPLKRSGRPRSVRRKPRRVSVNRDRAYLRFLASECTCVACGSAVANRFSDCVADGCGPVQAAHGPVNGMRSKGPDDGAVPLGLRHHAEQHGIGWPAFEERYGFSREKEAATHHAAYVIWKELYA
jgi:hypothetical protein